MLLYQHYLFLPIDDWLVTLLQSKTDTVCAPLGRTHSLRHYVQVTRSHFRSSRLIASTRQATWAVNLLPDSDCMFTYRVSRGRTVFTCRALLSLMPSDKPHICISSSRVKVSKSFPAKVKQNTFIEVMYNQGAIGLLLLFGVIGIIQWRRYTITY